MLVPVATWRTRARTRLSLGPVGQAQPWEQVILSPLQDRPMSTLAISGYVGKRFEEHDKIDFIGFGHLIPHT